MHQGLIICKTRDVQEALTVASAYRTSWLCFLNFNHFFKTSVAKSFQYEEKITYSEPDFCKSTIMTACLFTFLLTWSSWQNTPVYQEEPRDSIPDNKHELVLTPSMGQCAVKLSLANPQGRRSKDCESHSQFCTFLQFFSISAPSHRPVLAHSLFHLGSYLQMVKGRQKLNQYLPQGRARRLPLRESPGLRLGDWERSYVTREMLFPLQHGSCCSDPHKTSNPN